MTISLREIKRIRNILISAVYLLYVHLDLFFGDKGEKAYCTVLYYHSIPDVEANKFKRQMKILGRVSTPIPITYEGRLNPKKRYCIVTFDDAFKTVAANGVPELVRYGIPFTLFIPTANVGRKPEWLSNTGHKDEDECVLSIRELLDIRSRNVTFGSHAETHNDLTMVDLDLARAEISKSKAFLESNLKEEIRYLSFPHGAFTGPLIDLCRQAGYGQVFSITPESPTMPLRNYVKGRTKVDPSDWTIEFVLKAMGGYGWKGGILSARRRSQAVTN